MNDNGIPTISSDSKAFFCQIQIAGPPPQGWVPSTDCASAGFPCGDGTLCCSDPSVATSTGACYKVSDCGKLVDGGGFNMSEPFRLLNVDLATAKVAASPPLCTLKAGDCPWSMEAA